MTVEYLREQAARAERLAKSILDQTAFDGLMAMASEYREQAAALDACPVDGSTNLAQPVGCRRL